LRHAIIIIAAFHIHSAWAASTELDEKLRKEAAEIPNAALVFMERAPNAFSKAKKRYMGLIVGTPVQGKPAPQVNGTKQ
jgi:hypothetical protein